MKEISGILEFASMEAWWQWLTDHHAASPGVWVRLAKKQCKRPMLTHAEALDAALCHGWIDAQKQSESDTTWLQRFTPRSKKSIWSKINCAKAVALMEAGKMQPAGRDEVERAKADGRWDAAYDSPRTSTVPSDLETALDKNPQARAFFQTLNSANRYAVLWRIQTAKTPATRTKWIGRIIAMLNEGKTFHPQAGDS